MSDNREYSSTFKNLPLDTPNKWADYWYDTIGINPIPADTRNKRTYTQWSRWQVQSLPREQLEEWKQTNAFANGMAVIVGRVWRGKHAGKYFTFIDLDNLKGIEEFCTRDSKTVSLKEIAQQFIVEQHLDDTNKAHIYFFSEVPFFKKSSDVKSAPFSNPHQVDTSGTRRLK